MFKYLILFLLALSSCTGYVDEPIESDDDMNRKLMGRPIPVQVLEDTGWAQSGNLITFDGSKGVTLQANFSSPGNYTVQFGVDRPAPPNQNIPTRPEALVTWKVAGNQIVRRLSVGNGAAISGQGEGVSVRLFDSAQTGWPGTPGLVYPGTISVTKGVRASTQAPPVWQPIRVSNPVAAPPAVISTGVVVIAAGATANFPDVPEGATQLFVEVVADAVIPLSIVNGVIVLQQNPFVPTNIYYPFPGRWEPLVPGSTSVNVGNNTAASITVSLLFGIEG